MSIDEVHSRPPRGLFAVLVLFASLILLPSTTSAIDNQRPQHAEEPFEVINRDLSAKRLSANISETFYQSADFEQEYKRLLLPEPGGTTLDLDLKRTNIIASDARFLIGGSGGDQPMAASQVAVYTGTLADDDNAFAYLAVSPDGMINGFVERQTGSTIRFGTLPSDLKSGSRTLTVQETSAIGAGEVPFCGTDEVIPPEFRIEKDAQAVAFTSAGPVLVRVAIEADQSFVNALGSPLAAQDYIVQLVGAVGAIYLRDLSIRMKLVMARVWPSGGEPFTPYDISDFRTWWTNNEDTSQVEIVHLFSSKRDTPYGGIASFSNLCNNGAFGIDAYLAGTFVTPVTYPDGDNWDLNVVAHEMGHNCGTGHTHDSYSPTIDDCGNGIASPGTIMSYCHTAPGGGGERNIDLRFHRRVQFQIVNTVHPAGCLPYDCNGNLVDDSIDIVNGVSVDVDSNGIPDECEDCNNNGILDGADISGGAPDIDGNGIIDACESDCDGNSVPDRWETWSNLAVDFDGNNRPDACDPDCNNNGVLDYEEIFNNVDIDIDRNRVPDVCDDCNGNAVWDYEDIERSEGLLVTNLGSSEIKEYHALSGIHIDDLTLVNAAYDLVAPDSFIYIADSGAGDIKRYLPSADAIFTFVSSGTGGLGAPTAIAVGPNGNLFVADQAGDMIKEYDITTGAFVGDFIPLGTPLVGPMGLVFGPDGNLYVSSSDSAVYRYNSTTGAYVGPFVTPGSGGLNGARGLAFHPNGNLLVCSYSGWLIEYDGTTGAYLGAFNADIGKLTMTWDVEIGPNGNIFFSNVNSGGNYRVYEYYPNGLFKASFVRVSGLPFEPRGIAFRAQSQFDKNGNYLPDSCEAVDLDGDGVPPYADNCPGQLNIGQTDTDNDGVGDVCDNCPVTPNPDQRDFDGDGFGDVCDNCPSTANAAQNDDDSDGRGNECDNCVGLANDQKDSDGDFIGDNCDSCPDDQFNDADGDGLCASVDNCPTIFNPGQEDLNGNGVGDVCERPVLDTLSTACTRLVVSSHGNVGHSGESYVALDFWNAGDCTSIYLYDGSTVLLNNSFGSPEIYHQTYQDNQFVTDASGDLPDPVADSGNYEVFRSGAVLTYDSTLGIDYTFYAPKQVDSCNFIIKRTRIFSGDGGTHTNISIGDFVDFDIVDAQANTGGFDPSRDLVYQQGSGTSCQDNTTRFGGLAFLGLGSLGVLDTSVSAHNGLTESVGTHILPNNGLESNTMLTFMSASGYSALVGADDQFLMLTYFHDTTIAPGDTIEIVSAYMSIRNGSVKTPNASISSLSALTDAAVRWYADHVAPIAGPTCCVNIRGNVDGDGLEEISISDLTYLVSFQFGGGPAPACLEEANVNGVGGIDIADLTYLVSYMFGSGATPPACP